MSNEKEFRINEYLTVRLEKPFDPKFKRLQTAIYVGGRFFRQCKYLLLKIPVENISTFDEIDSIDEAADKLDKSLELAGGYEPKIPTDVEFWGHCSNLQVWEENDYDTRLIHSNLAFPLLKRLTEEGDPKAKKVFKDEIGRRLASGFPPVIEFLTEEKYVDYLSKKEVVTALSQIEWQDLAYLEQESYFYFLQHEDVIRILLEPKEAKAILDIERLTNQELTFGFYNQTEANLYIRDRHVIYLDLDFGIDSQAQQLEELPASLKSLTSLEILNLGGHKISEIPEWIENLISLKFLYLGRNNITSLPNSIGNLINLKNLNLRENPINIFPKTLNQLISLENIVLSNCNLEEVPIFIFFLKKLNSLDISENNIRKLPEWAKKRKIRININGNLFMN